MPWLQGTDFCLPAIPILSNVTGRPFNGEPEDWRTLMRAQITSPVRWEQSIRLLVEMGPELFIECGPGKVLAGLNKRICPDVKTFALEEADTLQEILVHLGRV